jgi:hypothetical protein
MKKRAALFAVATLIGFICQAQTSDAGMRKDRKAMKKELKSEWKDDKGKDSKEIKKEEKAIKKEDKVPKKDARKQLRELKGAEVSSLAQQAFAADFGNVTASMTERLDNFDEFTFTKDGITKSAFYDADAQLVGTTEVKKFSDLPSHAQQKIREWYSGYTVAEVLMFDDNENNDADMILYGYEFPGADSYFVELVNGTKKIVVHVSLDGNTIEYFTRLR